MHMDMAGFDEAEHVFIERQGQIRMQTTLEQNLRAAQRLGLRYLDRQRLLREHLAARIGRFEKGAERTGGDADIGIVDVAVDDIAHHRLRVQAPAQRMGEEAELVQARLPGQTQPLRSVNAFTRLDA